jgi:hypothetical protein
MVLSGVGFDRDAEWRYRRIRTDPTAALDAFRILGVRQQLVRP